MADDFITRKDLEKWLRTEMASLDTEADREFVIERLREEITSADVVPVRHGKWIETTQPMGWDDVTCAECSECGEDFVLDEWGMEDMKNLMHYCPNCGASMMDMEDGNG